MSLNKTLDTQRIDYLVRDAEAAAATITIAGLGSGGFPVMQYLAMCGVRRWKLFDPDALDPVNLVKHPARRSELGLLKVEIARKWLLDRNPQAVVELFPENAMPGSSFPQAVSESDLVLNCVDINSSREYVNDVCVQASKPFVLGLVFRRGFGGEVLAYVPGSTGCYRCLQHYTQSQGLSIDDDFGVFPEEEEQIYGLGHTDFRLSGLAMDINLIANLHAHTAFRHLVGTAGTEIPPLTYSWLTVGIRPFRDASSSSFKVSKFRLAPQEGCALGCEAAAESLSARKDDYATLGLPLGASRDRIKSRYRRLAKESHPDSANDGTAREVDFPAVTEAYRNLMRIGQV
jgi:hypothetical protein